MLIAKSEIISGWEWAKTIVGGITYDEIYQMWLNADELKEKYGYIIF